jgi:hypothetical protein
MLATTDNKGRRFGRHCRWRTSPNLFLNPYLEGVEYNRNISCNKIKIEVNITKFISKFIY